MDKGIYLRRDNYSVGGIDDGEKGGWYKTWIMLPLTPRLHMGQSLGTRESTYTNPESLLFLAKTSQNENQVNEAEIADGVGRRDEQQCLSW